MSFSDVCRNFASGLGKFIGAGHNALGWPRKALGKSIEKLRPLSSSKRIRSIVAEELIRFSARDAELTAKKLEERLQVITEAILALQEKINELSASGLIGESDLFKAMGSIEAAESLTSDERAMLLSIFRQNIAIQKPDLIDTAAEQNSLRVISS